MNFYPWEKQVLLVATSLRCYPSLWWWKLPRETRICPGKQKIRSWGKTKKEIQDASSILFSAVLAQIPERKLLEFLVSFEHIKQVGGTRSLE